MIDLQEIHADLAAFADDDEGYALDDAGDLMIHRNGIEITARILHETDGTVLVELDDQQLTYRDFLVRYLGQLDILAARLLEKRPGVDAFVDANARLETADDEQIDLKAIDALHSQCSDSQGFRSRVCFLTADAGQGKTILLREYQARNAQSFLAGTSGFVFWHVDLQGRQLLRLSEALMGDLGELRVSGLWMPAIIRLVRSRALVLAIDGFDELAAEQGGSDALGALATLVQQLDRQGVVVAASRRAFFDTDDYLRRAGMFGRAVAEPCEFNQLALSDWRAAESRSYLSLLDLDGQRFEDADATYTEIVGALGGSEDHPMVTRPYLLSHIARWLLTYDVSPTDFVTPTTDPMAGVASVVDAFVDREVAEKWRYRDNGDPYLDRQQHMQFLGDVAEEMYRAGKDRLQLDIVETLAMMRLEEWNIDPDRQRQVMEMVRMHALLQPPNNSDSQVRSFDHPEFRDYFVAIALKHHIEDIAAGQASGATEYLSIAQLSDSTARYVRSQLGDEFDFAAAAAGLAEAADRQLRSTYLQVNAGTLIPALIDGIESSETIRLVGRALYSSLVFERSRLANVTFERATCLNLSLRDIEWTDVTLVHCELGELSIHDTMAISNVILRDCPVDGIKRFVDGEEVERAYAPSRVRQLLAAAGFILEDQLTLLEEIPSPESEELSLCRRLIQCFVRSNSVTLEHLQRKFSHDYRWIVEELIPVLESYDVLEERMWRGRGSSRIWVMKHPLDKVLEAEDAEKGRLVGLWDEVRRLKRK